MGLIHRGVVAVWGVRVAGRGARLFLRGTQTPGGSTCCPQSSKSLVSYFASSYIVIWVFSVCIPYNQATQACIQLRSSSPDILFWKFPCRANDRIYTFSLRILPTFRKTPTADAYRLWAGSAMPLLYLPRPNFLPLQAKTWVLSVLCCKPFCRARQSPPSINTPMKEGSVREAIIEVGTKINFLLGTWLVSHLI